MNKKGNSVLVTLIIIGAVLILGGGIAIKYYKQNKTKNVQDGQNQIFQQQPTTTQIVQPNQGGDSSWKTYRNEQYRFEANYPVAKKSFEDIFNISAAPNMYLCPLRRNAEYRFLTDEQFKAGFEVVEGAGLCRSISFEEYTKHYNQSPYSLNVQKIKTADNTEAYSGALSIEVIPDPKTGQFGQLERRYVLIEIKGIPDIRALEFELKNEADLQLIDQIFSTFKFF